MSANTILTSVVTGGSSSHATVAEEANTYATDFVSAGVVGTFGLNAGSGGTGSYAVNADASPDMGVTVKSGQAYIVATPSGQNSQTLRARAATDYTTYVINANASGSTKYDWIYLSVSATNANTPSASADNVTSIVTSRSSSNSTDNGTPPTYGLLLAVITVANGASSITNSNISDRRVQASVSTAGTSATTGWITGLTVPTTVTANGNRSYSLVFNGTDITGTVSAGMRLKTTRLVAAPTQCTSLNGTTQYYSKTSPAGMTFTDDFIVSTWVKVTSYQQSFIVSRYNGTSGWGLGLEVDGRVSIYGFNAGAGNFSAATSRQSLPLNKWVHIAAQLDMSSFTATPTTSYVMIDGVDVPTAVGRSGTNPTALIQAGNLEIGSWNGGLLPFAGKIAQVAIYNAKVTQATILASINQTLSGSETSLISAYSFNNTINDLNANANNLTANGSAVATNADSPFGGQADGTISSTLDYAIITKTAFSTNTTLTVQVPEGCTIPTSGGVSAVSYSTQKVPYLFPDPKGKWEVNATYAGNVGAVTISGLSQWFNLLAQLTMPIGEWIIGYEGTVQGVAGTSISQWGFLLSPATPTNAVRTLELCSGELTTPIANTLKNFTRKSSISLAAATAYIFYGEVVVNSGATTIAVRGDVGLFVIKAENALL
jgi:hypothetical protein